VKREVSFLAGLTLASRANDNPARRDGRSQLGDLHRQTANMCACRASSRGPVRRRHRTPIRDDDRQLQGWPERHWLPCSLSASALRQHAGRRYRFVPPARVVAGRGLMLRACYLAAAAVAVGNAERAGLGSEVLRTRDRIVGRRRAVCLLPGADLGFGAGGCRGGRARDLRATRFLPRAPRAGAGFCARRPRGDCGLGTTPERVRARPGSPVRGGERLERRDQ
jgi:hypothetical protein